MVGGKVEEIVLQENRIWLSVRDKVYKNDVSAIYVKKNTDSEAIKIGDNVWWQGHFVMWTPQGSEHRECGTDFDIQIPRMSYSGVGVPDNYFSSEGNQ
jgi:hypothetical protein